VPRRARDHHDDRSRRAARAAERRAQRRAPLERGAGGEVRAAGRAGHPARRRDHRERRLLERRQPAQHPVAERFDRARGDRDDVRHHRRGVRPVGRRHLCRRRRRLREVHGRLDDPFAGFFALLVGAGAGLINGWVVTRLRVNPFIGTIGTGATIGGLVYIYSDSSPVQVDDPAFQSLGLGLVAGIPWAVIVTVLVAVAAGLLLSKTVFGRYTYAAGGNAEAARLAGVPVGRVRVSTFVIVGVLAALAGMITASQLSVGQPTLGATVALDAFAIVVIGGTSVYGGEGAIWRTATGVLIIAVLTNVFNYMAWDDTRQSVAMGVVLVGAVALDAMRRHGR
jgi:ribose transport system permease protein